MRTSWTFWASPFEVQLVIFSMRFVFKSWFVGKIGLKLIFDFYNTLFLFWYLVHTYRTHAITTTDEEQMSGPDLHVFTLKFLALKKLYFPHKKYFPKFFWLLFTFILCKWLVQDSFHNQFKIFWYGVLFKMRGIF